MNNRFPNDHPQQQQFYNQNSNYNGPPTHQQDNFGHQEQRFPQNRYDLLMNHLREEDRETTTVKKALVKFSIVVVVAAYLALL